MIRHPQKAAFGELKWQVDDGQIDGAYVEWSPLGQCLWDCIQLIPVRHPQIQIVAARIMPDHLHMVLYVTETPTSLFARLSEGGYKVVANRQKLVDFNRMSFLTAHSFA